MNDFRASTHIVSVIGNKRVELESVFSKLAAKAAKMNLPIPTLTYTGSHKVKKTIITTLEGESDSSEYEIELFDYKIDVVETFKFAGWNLLATVFYQDSLVDLINENYTYPAQYGLSFNKCEHCGHSHPNRIKSFIVQQHRRPIRPVKNPLQLRPGDGRRRTFG